MHKGQVSIPVSHFYREKAEEMRQCAVSTIYSIYTSESLKRMCKLWVYLVITEFVVVNNIVEKVIQNDIKAMKNIFICKQKNVLPFGQEKNESHERYHWFQLPVQWACTVTQCEGPLVTTLANMQCKKDLIHKNLCLKSSTTAPECGRLIQLIWAHKNRCFLIRI